MRINLALSSLILLLIRGVGAVLAFFLIYSIQDVYGKKVLGEYFVSFSIVLIASIISRLGFETLVLKSLSRGLNNTNINQVKSLNSILLISSFFTTFILLLTSAFVTKLYGIDHGLYLWMVLSITLINFITLHQDMLKGLGSPFKGSIIFTILFPILFASLIYIFDKSLGILFFLAHLILLATSIIFKKQLLTFHSLKRLKANVASAYILRSLPLMVTTLTVFAMSWIDILVLGYFQGSEIVADYGIVSKLAFVFSFITFLTQSLFLTRITKNRKDIKLKMKEHRRILIFVIMIFVLSYLILYKYAFSFYEISMDSQWILLVLGGGYILYIIGYVYFSVVLRLKISKAFSLIGFGSIFSNFIFSIIFVSSYGAIGVAFGTFMGYLIYMLGFRYLYKKVMYES